MPGLFGCVSADAGRNITQRFGTMRSIMQRGGRSRLEDEVDPQGRWALGRAHLGILQPEPQLASRQGPRAMVHGDLHHLDTLIASLKAEGASGLTTPAAVLAALYRRHGARVAQHLSGSFSAAILDPDTRQLLIISDRVGSYPLYWLSDDEGFAFAAEAKPLVKSQAQPALDPTTVNDMLTLGFPFGDKTLATGVKLLPPASVLTFSFADRPTVSLDTYSTWSDRFKGNATSKPEFLEQLGAAFDQTMQRGIEGKHRYGLSLSGGLDTRVLLSELGRQHVPLATFTLGGKGCADEVIGYQLAKLVNSQHRFTALEDQYLADLLPRAKKMVSLTDGMYISHGFTETLALQAFEESSFDVLLRGHAGELAKASTAYPLHTDAAIFDMTSRSQFVAHMLARLQGLHHPASAAGLFTPAFAAGHDEAAARGSIERAIGDATLSPPDLSSYLYLTQYHRRVTVPSLEIFRSAVDVRLPLADPAFVEMVLLAPPRWRDGLEIHQKLIARSNPSYLKVRNPNTGGPAGATGWQEFMYDKLNSVLRRLNVYGYRHYHAFDGWMRKAFVDVMDQVLLTPETLDRGVLQPDTMKRLATEARNGTGDHDHALQVLIAVELWQRENL